ncbi:cytochrome c [Lutimaribacter marinistellae]|uniref:Cytochrome c n=1 Tax=Lutimaribacter marinistellae TaxID=1820329 RepID=A0ABV7TDQ4_9RHOB
MNTRLLAYGFAGLAVAATAGWMIVSSQRDDASAPDLASLTLPTLTPEQEEGRALFDANCAACHGVNAAGSAQGPPLVHRIYEPSHHGDMAFVLAAKQGVRAHHWRFGNMPAVEGVSDEDVLQITHYVRALQRASGIE